MPRDYASKKVPNRNRKKSGATRTNEKNTSVWSLLIVVVLVGAFAAFLFYLDSIPDSGKTASVKVPEKKSPAIKSNQKTPAEPPQQFDFYTVLPDREVEVIVYEDEPEDVKNKKIIKTDTRPQSPQQELYQLQVGAFEEISKADAMKARLAMMGIESNIHSLQGKNGKKVYRVKIGPVSDTRKINQLQQQLKQQNINTFVQKVKV